MSYGIRKQGVIYSADQRRLSDPDLPASPEWWVNCHVASKARELTLATVLHLAVLRRKIAQGPNRHLPLKRPEYGLYATFQQQIINPLKASQGLEAYRDTVCYVDELLQQGFLHTIQEIEVMLIGSIEVSIDIRTYIRAYGLLSLVIFLVLSLRPSSPRCRSYAPMYRKTMISAGVTKASSNSSEIYATV